MSRQRQMLIEFDPERLKLVRKICSSVDQDELVNGLVEMYLGFVRNEKGEITKDGRNY